MIKTMGSINNSIDIYNIYFLNTHIYKSTITKE